MRKLRFSCTIRKNFGNRIIEVEKGQREDNVRQKEENTFSSLENYVLLSLSGGKGGGVGSGGSGKGDDSGCRGDVVHRRMYANTATRL